VKASQRQSLAGRIRAERDGLAARINDEFFSRHPDWRERYGERGVRRGFEDTCFHLDFLQGAIAAGSVAAFEEYARWTGNVLSSRGIDTRYLTESLLQIGEICQKVIADPEREYVQRFMRAAVAALESPRAAGEDVNGEESRERAVACRLFTQAILQGQRKPAACIVAQEVEKGTSLLDIYVDILEAAQIEIGRLWETNVISVAQEHMATAITQYVIAQLYPRIERMETVRGRVVITGVEGEFHHVGSNIVADALEASGWDVRFLGANVPHAGILRVIDEHRADVVGISVAMLFNIHRLIDLIESIDKTFGQGVRVIVGGSAFRLSPQIWKSTGAHGFAQNAREAVAMVNALGPRSPGP
jgi:methanogenic corrinoid protein MtbC1